MEGHTGSPSGSFVLPTCILSEQLGETFPGESEGIVTHLPSNVGIHPETPWHPYTAPFSNEQAIPAHLPLGSEGFMPLVSVP